MKIAIAGAGKLGLRIIEILMGGDHSITLIDKDEALINRLSATMDVTTVAGNAKEISLLEEIGIRDFDYFITTTDRDEKNIVIGTTAKKLGVPKVIARIRDPEYMKQYEFLKETFGIDHIVNPDRSVAQEITKYLLEKYSIFGGLLHAGRVSLLEFNVNRKPELVGMSLSEAREILRPLGMSLSAISKNGKLIVLMASDDCVIEQDDSLYVVGDRDLIDGTAASLVDKEKSKDIQRVMIAGGGKSGFYLAHLLEEFGASVKIIEIDKLRCQYLSTHLKNVLVLNGDATDTELLNSENLQEMDAFVSLTGFDEENLLLALLAKREGIEDVIAKISRESFGELITGMGVDMALNPVDIEAAHIVRRIKGATILSSQILQGQAEFVYLTIDHGMTVIGKQIGNLKLPPGLTIVALQRGTKVILPEKETTIEEGDRMTILSLLSDSFDLEKLLKVKHRLFA
ncbi:MAG: Trk system potassium transporter TrkA [Clostridiales Family XIII bacterium]|jgi:trk system potassium uptake protein TrkA|nr:Trk system potassium transporter TrkA [Clostridiales Family XIII bacterium]